MIRYGVIGGVAASTFIIFAALAYMQVIFVPYFTPATLQIEGLRQEYNTGENMTFIVSVNGYGSNCHMLQVEALDQQGERVSYYRKADDCRFMTITHGPYNLTRTFDYDGEKVFGSESTYTLDAQFEDLVDGTRASTTRNLIIR